MNAKLLLGKAEGKRHFGRPCRKWEIIHLLQRAKDARLGIGFIRLGLGPNHC